MTTPDFIKWFIDEHPIVFILSAWFVSTAISGLGRIGSTTVERKDTKEASK